MIIHFSPSIRRKIKDVEKGQDVDEDFPFGSRLELSFWRVIQVFPISKYRYNITFSDSIWYTHISPYPYCVIVGYSSFIFDLGPINFEVWSQRKWRNSDRRVAEACHSLDSALGSNSTFDSCCKRKNLKLLV